VIGGVNISASNIIAPDDYGYLNTVETWQPGDKEWTIDKSFSWVPALGGASVVYKNSIFLIGGLVGGPAPLPLRNISMFNKDNNSWVTMNDTGLPTPRQDHAAVVHGDFIYVIGGFDGNNLLDDVYRIQLSTLTPTSNSKWEKMNSINNAIRGHAALEFKNKIYVIGGEYTSSNSEADTTIRIYDDKSDKWSIINVVNEHGMSLGYQRYNHGSVVSPLRSQT